jgi:hypothetical protein
MLLAPSAMIAPQPFITTFAMETDGVFGINTKIRKQRA